MLVIPDNVIFVDVDDTLLLSEYGELLSEGYTLNKPLITKIKEWYNSGRTIIVFTSNALGVDHARKAVIECGLEDFVAQVQPKPATIVDDDHLEYYTIIDPITLERR